MELQFSLKVDPTDIRATLDELLAKRLLIPDGAHLLPTDTGRELVTAIAEKTAPITARRWGGIAAEDLAAAGRVLTLVTERANASVGRWNPALLEALGHPTAAAAAPPRLPSRKAPFRPLDDMQGCRLSS
ncbi:hypothetical protein [Streptomyces sp. NPDC046161]|uniref:hypothetical protein n=1 Tax=Streptomyces sp. NPDC046161 TaxID=3155132 RepID=UPI003405551A